MNQEPFDELEPPRGCVAFMNAVAIITGLVLLAIACRAIWTALS